MQKCKVSLKLSNISSFLSTAWLEYSESIAINFAVSKINASDSLTANTANHSYLDLGPNRSPAAIDLEPSARFLRSNRSAQKSSRGTNVQFVEKKKAIAHHSSSNAT